MENRIRMLDFGNDALFKALVRDERCKKFISGILSEITKISKEEFIKAKFLGGEIPKKQKKEKGKASDILIFFRKWNYCHIRDESIFL